MGYIQCSGCGGTSGTLVKDGLGGYRHQRPEDCAAHHKAEKKATAKRAAESGLVVARPKLILPNAPTTPQTKLHV